MKETKNDGSDTAVAGRIKMPTPGSSLLFRNSRDRNSTILMCWSGWTEQQTGMRNEKRGRGPFFNDTAVADRTHQDADAGSVHLLFRNSRDRNSTILMCWSGWTERQERRTHNARGFGPFFIAGASALPMLSRSTGLKGCFSALERAWAKRPGGLRHSRALGATVAGRR